jgi:hypothetical protein
LDFVFAAVKTGWLCFGLRRYPADEDLPSLAAPVKTAGGPRLRSLTCGSASADRLSWRRLEAAATGVAASLGMTGRSTRQPELMTHSGSSTRNLAYLNSLHFCRDAYSHSIVKVPDKTLIVFGKICSNRDLSG